MESERAGTTARTQRLSKASDTDVSSELRGRLSGTEMLRRKEVEVMGLRGALKNLIR